MTPPGHAPAPPTTAQLAGRALLRRCPVCGAGGLFERWFRMVERCPRCGLRFERAEGQWTGSLGMNTILSFGALLVVLVVGIVVTFPDIPVVGLTLLSAAVAVIAPMLIFPWSRTLWTAIDLMMQPVRAEEVDPAWASVAERPAGRRTSRSGRAGGRPLP